MTASTAALTSANIALREATAALKIKRKVSRIAPHLDEPACKLVTADVGNALDAMSRLLRTAGLEPVPASAASHNLQAVIQCINEAASMARRTARSDDDGSGPHYWEPTGR